MEPSPPTNVRVELADGRTVPCELTYDGLDGDGIHVWRAVAPVGVTVADLTAGRALVRLDELPAKTGITVELAEAQA